MTNQQQFQQNFGQNPQAPAGSFGATPQQPGAPNIAPQNTQPSKLSNSAPANPNSTQNSLEIAEIREGIVVMRDGSFRAVIACKSINYDLMSQREKEGVEYSYQSFLNALNHPVQVLIRSQKIDIEPYLNKLADINRNQGNMLLARLMDDYIGFIENLSQDANIMDKTFFIVVPYDPMGDGSTTVDKAQGFFSGLFPKTTTVKKIERDMWEKARDEIKKRVDSITGGLFQIGVKSVQLNTKELSELYYNFYNPDTAVYEPLGDFENVATLYTKKAPSDNQGGF